MGEEEIERIMSDVNQWDIEDLRELADQCNILADRIR